GKRNLTTSTLWTPAVTFVPTPKSAAPKTISSASKPAWPSPFWCASSPRNRHYIAAGGSQTRPYDHRLCRGGSVTRPPLAKFRNNINHPQPLLKKEGSQ